MSTGRPQVDLEAEIVLFTVHLGQIASPALCAGISEEHAHISRKAARLSEDHGSLSERPARPTENQERMLRKAQRPEGHTPTLGRASKLQGPHETKPGLEATAGIPRNGTPAEAGLRSRQQEASKTDMPQHQHQPEPRGNKQLSQVEHKAIAAPEPAMSEQQNLAANQTKPEPNPLEEERKALEEERKAIAEERKAMQKERRAMEQEKIAKVLAAAPKTPPRSKRLDIVLSHFHPQRVQPALDFWLDFLESPKVSPSQI